VDEAPCQDVIIGDVNLEWLPILTHFTEDGGPYVTSAVAVVMHPSWDVTCPFTGSCVWPPHFTARW